MPKKKLLPYLPSPSTKILFLEMTLSNWKLEDEGRPRSNLMIERSIKSYDFVVYLRERRTIVLRS